MVFKGVVLRSVRVNGVSRHEYIGLVFNITAPELRDMSRRMATKFMTDSIEKMKAFGATHADILGMKHRMMPLLRLTEFCHALNTMVQKRSDTPAISEVNHYKPVQEKTRRARGPYRNYKMNEASECLQETANKNKLDQVMAVPLIDKIDRKRAVMKSG